MPFFDRLTTSIHWRVRQQMWRDWLRVGGKCIRPDPRLISPYVAKLIALGRYEKPERDLLEYMKQHRLISRGDRVIEARAGLGAVTMQIADIVGDDPVTAMPKAQNSSCFVRSRIGDACTPSISNSNPACCHATRSAMFAYMEKAGFIRQSIPDSALTTLLVRRGSGP
jgi:hypothetical protein